LLLALTSTWPKPLRSLKHANEGTTPADKAARAEAKDGALVDAVFKALADAGSAPVLR
jgi:hypothetical protein